MKRFLLIALLFTAGEIAFAQPVIDSFSPQTALPGTSITITGSGFSAVADSNVVFFGPVKGRVTAATISELTVEVPTSAAYSLLSVTTSRLTCFSRQYFTLLTSSLSQQLDSNSFEPAFLINPNNGFTNNTATMVYDADDDKKIDIASTDSIFRNAISLYSNVSFPGTLNQQSFTVLPELATGYTSNAPFLFADFDGDGKKDLVTKSSWDNRINFFKNTSTAGNISFLNNGYIYDSVTAAGLGGADFDLDGKIDLVYVAMHDAFPSIVIRRNTSAATGQFSFQNPLYTVSQATSRISCMRVADMNSDGKPDVVYAIEYGSKIYIMANTTVGGNISFSAPVSFETATRNEEIEIGDLDNDGLPDLVLCGQQNLISVFRNTSTAGTIALAQRINLSTTKSVLDIVINDLDGDGKADIAGVGDFNYNTRAVMLWKNNSTVGNLNFNNANEIKMQPNIGCMSSADLDGDGRQDLIVGGYSPSVLRNKTGDAQKFDACNSGRDTLIVAAGGTSYQWQLSTDSVNFTDLFNNSSYSGVHTNWLTLQTLNSSMYGYRYRCIVDGAYSKTFELNFKNTWTGFLDLRWENPGNWSCNVLPDANTDVIIPSGVVTLSSNASCRSIRVSPGATFTVSPGFALIVTH